jgi:hypothetical protein
MKTRKYNYAKMPTRKSKEQYHGGKQTKTPFNKKQKVALFILIILSIFIFVFWFLQSKNRINNPFRYDKKEGAENLCQGEECTAAELAAIKQDTDGDGLTDRNEVDIYGTSPYLEDSDSDGLTDYQEIQSGSNPTCPLGSSCNGTVDYSDIATSTEEEQIEVVSDLFTGQVDTATLREMILISGSMTEEEISVLTDEELLEIYTNLVNELQNE